jgi:hypothetical protein
MFSELKVLDAICFWCGQGKECVAVEIKKGQSVDLCWSCLRTKANAESGRSKGKSKAKTHEPGASES